MIYIIYIKRKRDETIKQHKRNMFFNFIIRSKNVKSKKDNTGKI